MSKIAGQRRGEAYPEAPRSSGVASAIVRMGFDNSTEGYTYSNDTENFQPVLRAAGQRLQVPLTGFTLGNVILIEFTFTAEAASPSGVQNISVGVFPCVDAGAGFEVIDIAENAAQAVLDANTIAISQTFSMIAFVRPSAFTSDPIVGVNFISPVVAGDLLRVAARGAMLVAYECDASRVTQFPTTVLVP